MKNNNHDHSSFAQRIRQVKGLLENSHRILVASHVDPDGDAVGTQLAFASYLRDLGKETLVVRDSIIPEKYLFLAGAREIAHIDSLDSNLTVDTALILECPVIERLGRTAQFLKNGVKIVSIDHHQGNSRFGEVNWINEQASSVGEMAFEYFLKAGYQLSPETAEQLYTAILTDTGRFRYSSTSYRTMQIAGLLIDCGADPQKVCDLVYYDMRSSTLKLLGKVLDGVEFHHEGLTCLLTLTKSMLARTGAHESESDGIVDFTLFSHGVKAGALLKEIDDKHTKVSLRSRDAIDVAELAASVGGGGHCNASGCTMSMPLTDAKREILRLLAEAHNGQSR